VAAKARRGNSPVMPLRGKSRISAAALESNTSVFGDLRRAKPSLRRGDPWGDRVFTKHLRA
jgi:hypothetical protein